MGIDQRVHDLTPDNALEHPALPQLVGGHQVNRPSHRGTEREPVTTGCALIALIVGVHEH